MRGKVPSRKEQHHVTGITPAHAGKRASDCSGNISDWDHPRTCGEKTAPRQRLHLVRGSPPHMRGKVFGRFCPESAVGITPAHAGKSRCGEAFEYYDKDHPRTCGEKNLPAWNNQTLLGSPPHMRGKVPHVPVAAFAERITPAHAGKRLPVFSGYIRSQDHPRTCGEKKSHTITSRVCLGSPPHMRGKDQRAVRQAHGSRITPAHAGKRRVLYAVSGAGEDHPRTCGEKRTGTGQHGSIQGSPPHMRGKVQG